MSHPIQLTAQFEAALLYATRLHATQLRKDGRTPYIAHLLSVAALVLENGGDEDEAIAALLHDAVEDQGGARTRTQIQTQFGDHVTAIVDACTEAVPLPHLSWEDCKQQYVEQIRQASPAVCRVSLSDKLHNARTLLASLHQEGEQIWTRFHGGREKMLWFYHQLLEVYQSKGTNIMTQELAQIIAEIEGR